MMGGGAPSRKRGAPCAADGAAAGSTGKRHVNTAGGSATARSVPVAAVPSARTESRSARVKSVTVSVSRWWQCHLPSPAETGKARGGARAGKSTCKE